MNRFETETIKPAKKNRAAGQAVVEVALVMPLLILLTLGVVEFGLLFLDGYRLSCAVREAGRLAAMGLPETEVPKRAVASAGLESASTSFKLSYPEGRNPGSPVVVEGLTLHKSLTPLMGFKPFRLSQKVAFSLESF